MTYLDDAIEAALEVLDRAGVARRRVVLAVAEPLGRGGDTEYATHVGATEDRDEAALISIIAADLASEARQQGASLAADKACPDCGSQRYGLKPRALTGGSRYRVEFRWECMSCGHVGPAR